MSLSRSEAIQTVKSIIRSAGLSPQELVDELVASNEAAPNYLSRDDVAKRLNVSKITLHRWHKRGILRSRKIGGRVLYLISEVEQAVRQNDPDPPEEVQR